MKELLIDAGFPIGFDDEVMAAAHALDERITREEERKRKDCRDILTFTIDRWMKDFDDAISIRNPDNGCYEIGAHCRCQPSVTIGSILDKSAYERATSVFARQG